MIIDQPPVSGLNRYDLPDEGITREGIGVPRPAIFTEALHVVDEEVFDDQRGPIRCQQDGVWHEVAEGQLLIYYDPAPTQQDPLALQPKRAAYLAHDGKLQSIGFSEDGHLIFAGGVPEVVTKWMNTVHEHREHLRASIGGPTVALSMLPQAFTVGDMRKTRVDLGEDGRPEWPYAGTHRARPTGRPAKRR